MDSEGAEEYSPGRIRALVKELPGWQYVSGRRLLRWEAVLRSDLEAAAHAGVALCLGGLGGLMPEIILSGPRLTVLWREPRVGVGGTVLHLAAGYCAALGLTQSSRQGAPAEARDEPL